MLLAPCLPAEAQQPAGIPRIGIMLPTTASFYLPRVEAFRQRLRELEYVEGKNIVIEYRYAEGKLERLPDLAAELVRLKGGTRGNLTLTDMEAAAKALGFKLQSLPVRGLDDFESAFARAKTEGAQALVTTVSPLINTQQRQVLDFAAKNGLPAMYTASEFVEAGGLMSYAPSSTDLYRRAADFVDKILKGTKPADIPVEQPTKFEFVINLEDRQADRPDDSAGGAGAGDVGLSNDSGHQSAISCQQKPRR